MITARHPVLLGVVSVLPEISSHYTVKKVSDFPQPGCHLQNSPWPGIIKFLNYSPPGRVWLVTSQQWTGKSLTFFTV